MEPPLPDAQVAGGLMRPEAEDVAAPAALRAALALGWRRRWTRRLTI